MQNTALQLAEELKIADFTASDGWLHRFKKRNNISLKRECGEISGKICDALADRTQSGTIPPGNNDETPS